MVCSGVGKHHRFREICWLSLQGRSDVVGSALLRNTRTRLPDYMVSHLKYGHFHAHRSKSLKYHLSKRDNKI